MVGGGGQLLMNLSQQLSMLPFTIFNSWPLLFVATLIRWVSNRVIVAFTPDVAGPFGELVGLFVVSLSDFIQFRVFSAQPLSTGR